MEEPPASTQHVLRPHHLVVLSILMIAFKDNEVRKLHPTFALHLHRVLLREIAEVTTPTCHRDLLTEITTGPFANAPECAHFLTVITSIHTDIYTTEKMANFLGNIPILFFDKAMEQDSSKFTRKSIFGFFCRRCFVDYQKMSYGGLNQLTKDYQNWCSGGIFKSYERAPSPGLGIDYLVHKTQSDRQTWAQGSVYALWEKSMAVGDENTAVENIRRFFEQHFHDNTDSGFRQHALLNVAHMHYINKEHVAARKLLGEAITVSRTANDRTTLLHSLSLLHRLPPAPTSKPPINEIQPNLNPLEVLYDVKKLMDEENEQPLSAAFNKVVEAMGLYDHCLEGRRDRHSAVPNDDYQWAQHAVQSTIWQEAGCEKLAEISENVVIAFTEVGGDDSSRLTVLLNRAYRIARQGRYNEALSTLLEPTTWRGLTNADHRIWAHEVWAILALRASRRGQDRLYREYLLPRRPQGEYNPRYYHFEQQLSTSLPAVRQSIYQVLQFKQHDQLSTATNDLLKLLWRSEFLGRHHAYRTGIILMADFGLEFGMVKKSKRILEEIIPQIIVGNDKELRAVGCFTFARCILAGEPQPGDLDEALKFLKIAEEDFSHLQIYQSLKEVLYFQAVIMENKNDAKASDLLVAQYETVEEVAKQFAAVVVDPEVQEIHSLLVSIGAGLAQR